MRHLLLLIAMWIAGCGATSSRSVDAQPQSLSSGGAPATPPNILLIILDDVGAEASSLYPEFVGDSGAASTPNLEALAAGGLTFSNAWATPLCTPSRATIVSGRYSHHTGTPNNADPLPADTVTIFDRLTAETDYGSALIGKSHLGTSTAHLASIGVPYFKGALGNITNYYSWTTSRFGAANYTNTTFSTTAITDFGIEFIQQHELATPDKPWFLHQAYNAAHEKLRVPPSHLHTVDLGGAAPGTLLETVPNYKANIQAADTEIARLLAVIDLSETTVIVIGDNGTTADVKDTGAGVRGSKASPLEGGIRVPLFVAGAGVTRYGRESALVQATDLYATILALAGLPVTQEFNSYSFAPLLTDADATPLRTHAFTEKGNSDGSSHRFAIRDSRYKLLKSGSGWGLYDLETDPLELANRYSNSAYAAQRASLEAALAPIIAAAPPEYFP